jgi:hypothetical protein
MKHQIQLHGSLRAIGVLAVAGLSLSGGPTATADRTREEGAAEVTISVWPRTLTVEADARWCGVRVLITNSGQKAVYVRRWLSVQPSGHGARTPLLVRAADQSGKPLEYEGAIAKLAAVRAEDFVLLEPGHCYGVVVELSSLFPALKRPGSYTVWFRYQNKDQPRGLRKEQVWVGETEEAACSLQVK